MPSDSLAEATKGIDAGEVNLSPLNRVAKLTIGGLFETTEISTTDEVVVRES